MVQPVKRAATDFRIIAPQTINPLLYKFLYKMDHSIYQPLYQLLKKALWQTPVNPAQFSSLTGAQWELLLKIAQSQGIYGIISDAIFSLPQEIQPLKNIKIAYGINIHHIQKRYYHTGAVACKMAEEFAARHIPMMIMKGLGTADMYPHPQVREFGDIDLYLFGHYKEGNKMAKAQGIKVENELGKHSNYYIDGVPIENHQNFLNVKSFKIDRILESYLDNLLNEILSRKEYFAIRYPDGHTQPTQILLPTPDFNAIFLLRHALTHFGSGNMVLRHLCDWACFLSHYHQQVNWEKVREIFDRANITRFCESFTYMVCKYLGMPVEYAVPILKNKISVTEPGKINGDDSSKINCTDPEMEALAQQLFEEIAGCQFFMKDPNAKQPKGLGIILYKCKRIAATRWKYDLIYSGGGFWREKIWGSIVAHLKHPQTIFRI